MSMQHRRRTAGAVTAIAAAGIGAGAVIANAAQHSTLAAESAGEYVFACVNNKRARSTTWSSAIRCRINAAIRTRRCGTGPPPRQSRPLRRSVGVCFSIRDARSLVFKSPGLPDAADFPATVRECLRLRLHVPEPVSKPVPEPLGHQCGLSA
jgi:hypothetical protein